VLKEVFVATGVAAFALVGCGGDKRSETTAKPAATTNATGTTSTKAAKKARPKRMRSAAQTARIKRVKAYERAFDALTYHEGPLRVDQTVQYEHQPDFIEVRVPVKHFFCDLKPGERRAAIKAYYDLAAPQLRVSGQRPYKMNVGDASSSGDIKHLYARVRNGVVSMTNEGVATRRCG